MFDDNYMETDETAAAASYRLARAAINVDRALSNALLQRIPDIIQALHLAAGLIQQARTALDKELGQVGQP